MVPVRWQHLRQKNGILPAVTVKTFADVNTAIVSEQDVEVLILDAPSHAPQLTRDIAGVAHLLVQPCGPGFDDLQPAVDLFYQLIGIGIPKGRLCMALSRILDGEEEAAARAYIAVADFNVLPGSITERARYRDAHNRGLAFIESPGEDLNSPAGVALGSLLTWIVQQPERILHPGQRWRVTPRAQE